MTNARSESQQDQNAGSVRKSDGEWDQRTRSDAQAASDMGNEAISNTNTNTDLLNAQYEALRYANDAEHLQDLLDAKERELAELRQDINDLPWKVQLQAKLNRVRELHFEAYGCCDHCTGENSVFWPCPTIQALDGSDES